MLSFLFSALPQSAQRKLLSWATGRAPHRSDLTNMSEAPAATGLFAYSGDELLHRDQAYASFAVVDSWSDARWGVTFDAIRKADPEWSDLLMSMRKLREHLMLAGNALFTARQFEKDGSLLVRDLEVQA
ncbi:MAG: hypothetical protein KKA16_10955 [Alphaproteobacteria bacterium]|nr:hypothetical protein [Alphaproteobacteria bacterium]MBU2380196.1 hypothetical protein [Alphaproteobacteria bacterium]